MPIAMVMMMGAMPGKSCALRCPSGAEIFASVQLLPLLSKTRFCLYSLIDLEKNRIDSVYIDVDASDPNLPPQNNSARTEGRNLRDSTNQNTSTGSRTEGGSRRTMSSSFGSNIHTLKHDEDDNRFSDRNSFWNGNSTQYGGNGDER